MTRARIYYARVDEFWRKEQKYAYLEAAGHVGGVEWQELQPDARHNWLTEGMRDEFETFIPVGSKEGKSAKAGGVEAIFGLFSNGVKSNNDAYVFNFDEDSLSRSARQMVEDYNAEVDRWKRKGAPKDIEGFIKVDETRLKWIRNTKRNLLRGKYLEFDDSKLRQAAYRPFCTKFYYFERVFNEDVYGLPDFFPTPATEKENSVVCLSDAGFRSPFAALVTDKLSDIHLCASSDIFQCFPFYTYDEDGANRRENVTDWALEKFRAHYADASISKWDIFHYVYALLHHPLYRERYAANLRRELPRIPFAPDFRPFADAGARLADLHVNCESQPEYPLERIEREGAALDWRVERMKLTKDRRSLVYNDFLTLAGIPAEAFEYRLGNRSALEWLVDQYRTTTDARSRITNDPNRADDPQYVVRLVCQIVHVNVETVSIVRQLAARELQPTPAA